MARKVKLDMTGVESYSRAPEGTFKAKLKKIEESTTQGGDDALKAVFEILSGEGKGCSVIETFTLTEKALWKLKMFLEAVGVRANGRISIDLDRLVGKVCTIEVEHRDVNGTIRANISNYLKAAASSDADEEEDDEDEEFESEAEEEEEEEEVKKPAKKTTKKLAKTAKKVAPPEDDDDDDFEEEEDDEEEEAVKKSAKKPAPKKSAKPAKKKPAPVEEDDDEDWEEDEE